MEQGRLAGNTIVTTVMSNLGLYKACDKVGMKYEQTAVGDKYVYENMMKNGFVLGGEQSGHIIFSKHARTGDGILTSLMLMEVIMEKKQSLGKLCSEVKIYPQLLQNVRVTDKKTTLENEAVQNAIKAAAEALGSDGRILVRESGTEPVIRVMVEAATDEICTEYVNQVVNVMKEQGALNAMMSGSGPTVFGIYDSKEKARKAAAKIREKQLAKQVYVTGIHNARRK